MRVGVLKTEEMTACFQGLWLVVAMVLLLHGRATWRDWQLRSMSQLKAAATRLSCNYLQKKKLHQGPLLRRAWRQSQLLPLSSDSFSPWGSAPEWASGHRAKRSGTGKSLTLLIPANPIIQSSSGSSFQVRQLQIKGVFLGSHSC